MALFRRKQTAEPEPVADPHAEHRGAVLNLDTLSRHGARCECGKALAPWLTRDQRVVGHRPGIKFHRETECTASVEVANRAHTIADANVLDREAQKLAERAGEILATDPSLGNEAAAVRHAAKRTRDALIRFRDFDGPDAPNWEAAEAGLVDARAALKVLEEVPQYVGDTPEEKERRALARLGAVPAARPETIAEPLPPRKPLDGQFRFLRQHGRHEAGAIVPGTLRNIRALLELKLVEPLNPEHMA